MVDIATVDSQVSQQGQFCLLDWMLAENMIPYAAYENWRYGRIATLDDVFSLAPDDLQRLLQQAQQTCRELNLQQEAQTFYPWDGQQRQPLRISTDPERHATMAARWTARKDVPQMDLFMDNSAAIAENQVLDALANRQFQEAGAALQRLTKLNPRHGKLGGYQDLINYGLHCVASPTIAAEDLAAEFQGLDQEVALLAGELLGSRRRDFLAFAWRRMAENLRQKTFSPAEPELHCSYAYGQIPDWQALVTCLEQEPQLFESPILLARLAQGFLQCQQVNAFYLLWGILFERFAAEAERMIGQQGELLLEKWDQFLAFDDNWPAEVFLGFLLINQPGLVQVLNNLPLLQGVAITNPVNRAALELVRVRLAEQDERAARENLKNLNPVMLRFYLNKRDWFASLRKR
ncbi:MAG: hypothetical protein NVV73_05110 [Cellvibrionaceae bacterium]|nr:hypothetical protein [Cellvibrionaceae bacterium]